MNRTPFFAAVTTLLMLQAASALTQAAVVQTDGVWYDLDEKKHTAVVTCNDALRREGLPTYGEAVAIVIPASVKHNGKSYKVTAVGNYAFHNAQITAVTLPKGVTTIGECAFADCKHLKRVTLGTKVTQIGDSAFARCIRLEAFIIPSPVATIGAGAFKQCKAIRNMEIAETVKRIGDEAFADCKSLTAILFLTKTPPALGNDVFRNTAGKGNYQYINVPCGAGSTYKSAWQAHKKAVRELCK